MTTLPRASEAIGDIAAASDLLVACDFDGTLAPIVDDPALAAPLPEAMTALGALAALDRTHVAVISGRSRAELDQLAGVAAGVHLVGSHGAEFAGGPSALLDRRSASLRDTLIAEFDAIAAGVDGAFVEQKPTGAAFHYRLVAPELVAALIDDVLVGPASADGVRVRHGKKVVELSVVHTDKGTAVEQLRDELGAPTVLFLGDDTTDEDAFAVLAGGDVGVKVGPGATAATHRVDDPTDVARLLVDLCELRRARS